MEVDGAQGEPILDAALLVLAGGESRRMGRPKTLLPVAGKTLIEWQVSRLQAGFAQTLIAVAAPEQLPASLRDLAILDEVRGSGPLGGMLAGLAHARADMVFAVAVDMPHVSAAHARLLAPHLAGHEAAVPRSPRGAEPLCALYARAPARRAAEAALAAGELSLRDVLARLDVSFVDAGAFERALRNLNTPAEYEAFLGGLRP